MARKLYVGGLSHDTADDRLREAFATFGVVKSARVVRNRYSDASKGFGFVEMPNTSEAEEAIRRLNGTMLDGRQITVDNARGWSNGGGRLGGYRGGGAGNHARTRPISRTNLSSW